MADALSLIPASVLRNLADMLYQKRKNAALEIEGIVKQLAAAGDHDRITAVINLLTTEFIYSPQANLRKGGLIGLGAATVGLTMEAAQHLEQIVPPVLNSFSDQDSRVRYYACEALYNIAKTVRGDFIVFFNQISDALCKLSVDSDANVQSAALLVDRLVKDIVTESDQLSPYEENDQESKTIPANMEFNSSSTFKPVDPRRSGFNIDSQKERRLEVRDASGSTFVDQTGNTSIEKVAYTWEMLLETFPKKCPPGGKNSVVLYTSLDVMGDTNRVRSTFQNLQINYSLRDVINPAYEEELRNLLGELAELPALFVQGRYIGGAYAVQKLNKEGKLKILFGAIPKY
ncbi:hypothetical protein IFM89_003343 [Coptis chinensis]|uniref:Uncharacterized protein n=1 Tax=Coptis chinensis TaxID=261450 RepID=A0A835IUS8_9MAGN|nr:hypothetical protein IFM89_003343 [Coptis chinensis]